MNFVKARKSFFGVYNRFIHIFITLAVCIVFLFISKGIDSAFNLSSFLIENTTVHRFFEIFILIISFSIFFVAYYTYPQTHDNRLLIMGYIFLGGGLLYWIKVLGITNDVALFDSFLSCILIRFVNSVCFSILFTYEPKNKVNIRRSYLLLGATMFLLLSVLMIKSPEINNLFFTHEGTLSFVSAIVVLFDCLLYSYIFYRIYINSKQKNDVVNKTLSCALLIMLFSEIALLNVRQVYDMSTVVSQFYLAVSYGILFYSIYIFSVRRPYKLLSKIKEKRENDLVKMDKLVESRTKELRDMYDKLIADQDLARGIQLSMLPRELPKDEYVSFSVGYLPADELSGDFYYVIKIDETRYGICIGDVSGHGISAAMLSIFAFQKLQSLMEETEGGGMTIPSMVLQHLYDSFNSSNFNDDMYFVMLYGVFNTQTGIFSYSSGGLNTVPLRLRPDGSIQELDNDGFAICKLGSILKPKFVNYQILLFPGDKLILYTDGLVDAKNSQNEEYSLSRLKSTISDYSKFGIDYLADAIIKDAKKFTGAKASDDITLLIMDSLPPF